MNIFLASPTADVAIERLRVDHDVVIGFDAPDRWPELLEDREVIVFRSGVAITADVLRQAPKLELAIRAGSGSDNIDLEHCGERGMVASQRWCKKGIERGLPRVMLRDGWDGFGEVVRLLE